MNDQNETKKAEPAKTVYTEAKPNIRQIAANCDAETLELLKNELAGI